MDLVFPIPELNDIKELRQYMLLKSNIPDFNKTKENKDKKEKKVDDCFADMMKTAGTVVWNGPVGVFEFDQFGEGTKGLGLAIANSDAFSIAGGGDTLAAVDKYGIEDRVSYISTGGGAFLEFLEGKILPAVEMLEKRAQV